MFLKHCKTSLTLKKNPTHESYFKVIITIYKYTTLKWFFSPIKTENEEKYNLKKAKHPHIPTLITCPLMGRLLGQGQGHGQSHHLLLWVSSCPTTSSCRTYINSLSVTAFWNIATGFWITNKQFLWNRNLSRQTCLGLRLEVATWTII